MKNEKPTADSPFTHVGTVDKVPAIRRPWVDWCITQCANLDDNEWLYLKLDNTKSISSVVSLMRRYDIITRSRTVGGETYAFMQEERGRERGRMSAAVKSRDAKKRGLQELPASNLESVEITTHADPNREYLHTDR